MENKFNLSLGDLAIGSYEPLKEYIKDCSLLDLENGDITRNDLMDCVPSNLRLLMHKFIKQNMPNLQ
jgi:hypothetical protein